MITGILMDETSSLSLIEVCQQYNIPEAWLLELIEHGFFHEHVTEIDQQTLARLQSARRLQADLDLNIAGLVLVMELLDELKQMRQVASLLEKQGLGSSPS